MQDDTVEHVLESMSEVALEISNFKVPRCSSSWSPSFPPSPLSSSLYLPLSLSPSSPPGYFSLSLLILSSLNSLAGEIASGELIELEMDFGQVR